MTPAEQLVMELTTPVLDGVDAEQRLLIARMQRGDARYTALSSGEKAWLLMAAGLDVINRNLPAVDGVMQEVMAEALARMAAEAWHASDYAHGSHIRQQFIINRDGAA